MADVKISALPAASTPLTGTELVPIVQSGTTDQVTVANLTAGRTVAAAAVTAAAVSVDANSASVAVRITQIGAGNALLVEDSANPDASPYVIDASGRVISGYTAAITGVGSTVPRVQQAGTSANDTFYMTSRWDNSANAGGFDFAKSRGGSVNTNGIVTSGDTLGQIRFTGDDGAGFIVAASISSAVDGTPGTNDMPGRLVFSTTADGASGATERMRIDSSGNVGIGTSSPGAKLDVNGVLRSTGTSAILTVSKRSTGTGDAWGMYSQSGELNLYDYTAAVSRMVIDTSGNVGIGTSSPGHKLQVNGAIVSTDGTTTARVTVSGGVALVSTITNHPLAFQTNDTERARIDSSGNVIAGGSVALATTATNGFLYVPTCAGTPTGTPTAVTGMAPIVVNTTNNKLYFYSGGAWRDAGP